MTAHTMDRRFIQKISFGSLFALALFAPLFATASVSLATPNTNVLSNGLVGYWPLDGNTTNWTTGTTNDVSGNGNNAQLISMSTSTSPVAGKIGQALNFNGSNYIQDTSSAFNFSGTNTLTVAAWVKRQTSTSQMIVAGNGEFILGVGALGATTNQIKMTKYDVVDIYLGSFPADTKWHYIVGVWGKNGESLYIDGVLNATYTDTSNFTSSGSTGIDIGSDALFNSNQGYASGSIDDVRVYSRALSAQEVQMLYETGTFNLGTTPAANSSFSIDQGGLNSGLVAYWPLDGNTTSWATGTTNDVSGNNYNGQMTNFSTSTSPVAGKIGQALAFNGSNSYITTGYTVPAQSSATSFTWSAWMYVNSGNASNDVILGNRGGGGSTWIKLTPTAFEYNGGLISHTIPTGQWLFITIVKNGTNFTYYQNGAAIGTGSSSATTASYTFYMGQDPGYTSDGDFNGKLDDVRIYARALSQQEVQQLYDVGQVNIGHSNTTSTGLNSGLVGYWTFDGPTVNWSTGVAKDSSGSGDNSQLENFSTTTSPTIGKIGQALTFNGSNSYLNVSPFPSNTSPLTVSVWVYPTALSQGSFGGGTGGSIIDENEGGGSAGWDFGIDGGHSDELWFWPSGGNDRRSTGSVPLNQWTFVTATFDGTNLRFYINGKLDSTQSMPTPDGSATFFKIGAESWTTGYWKGKLDDVRIYNRALSAQEVAQLYTAGK